MVLVYVEGEAMEKVEIKSNDASNKKERVILLTTGGTIEKTYNEHDGSLKNNESVLCDQILSKLRLPYTEVDIFSILSKDSLQMTDEDREFLLTTMKFKLKEKVPIIVVHGTDTMSVSAEYCAKNLTDLEVPIIFTGAMRPLGFFDTDATQNVTESLMAAKMVSPGIYISFHGRLFTIPGARKNKDKGTFEAF
jgi:L-asparaginase